MGSADTINRFWRWFGQNLPQLNGLSSPNEPFWDRALAELQKVDDRLFFELSDPDGQAQREFVVTAEGQVPAFSIAEALVSAAPPIQNWVFVALKPPMGFALKTEYEGIQLEPQNLWFLPLNSPSHPADFGMRVGIRGLASLDRVNAHNAVLVMLDTVLGEKSAAADIQYVEVGELPDEPEKLGYIAMLELPEYLCWRKDLK